MGKANESLRAILWRNNIPLWQLGRQMGVCEMTVCRWMRTELAEDKQEQIQAAIAEILAERGVKA